MRERRKGKDQDQGADELDWERKSEFVLPRSELGYRNLGLERQD
jgi:hypothetical protein